MGARSGFRSLMKAVEVVIPGSLQEGDMSALFRADANAQSDIQGQYPLPHAYDSNTTKKSWR